MVEGTVEYISLNQQIIELEKNYNNLLMIKNGLNEINKNLETLEYNYEIFNTEIAKQELELKKGYDEYRLGLIKIEEAKIDANLKIEEAKSKLNDIEKPVWYLLDRTDSTGYIAYKEDIIKVEAIAKVLPIFFILIAVLMILNTLTRLIEEERNEIGILQSNGFSKTSIVISYLLYVVTAGLLGLGIGLTIGYSLIPKIIYGVFLASYYVPKLITIVSPLPFSLVITVTLLIIIGVTIVVCRKELKENPAYLLRPKPPKTGKKIFLERIHFIWKRLNFMDKTTIRNIFRYKKRIIMTILGVAGCTALLVTGLGINDSINAISKIQYKDIIKYDAMYILKDNIKELSKDLIKLYKDNGVVNPLLVNQNAYTFSFDNKTEDVYMVVPFDYITFNNYVNLTSPINNKKISIDDKGAIITKKMADLLKVNIGDSISIRSSNNELIILYVSGITNNYVSHYIYMSNVYYKEVFEKDITYNSVIANGKINDNVKLTEYNVLMVNYTDDIVKTFDIFVEGINQIIILIVVFACFLAFVVLYNLTIINVSERKREIATFKVLGFYDKEVSSYIYRETLFLTISGILVGLFLGIFLHRFVIGAAETDSIMFLRQINTTSFLLSGLITILFSVIVQSIINRVLKKIDMIESLKSAE
jgi:putative ABC transport system permease protein